MTRPDSLEPEPRRRAAPGDLYHLCLPSLPEGPASPLVAQSSGEVSGRKLSDANRRDVPGARDSIDDRLSAGKRRLAVVRSDLVYVVELTRSVGPSAGTIR
jgi:hypothetical protein